MLFKRLRTLERTHQMPAFAMRNTLVSTLAATLAAVLVAVSCGFSASTAFSQAPLSSAATNPAVRENGQSSTTTGAFSWLPDSEGVSLMQNKALVLRYQFVSESKPIVYPIIGPGGTNMTRDFPMKSADKGGTKDHVHHRSLWMTHGEVNGIDFWMEGEKAGRIVHDAVVSSDVSQAGAKLATTANWVTPDNKVLLRESRIMTVSGDDNTRAIEFEIDLTAGDEKVHFGDTKEGSFGIRVPDSMAVDSKLGGTILNEHGEHDGDAWGKKSRWVDYSGPVTDPQTATEKVVGITVLEHPASFGHPCRWHVRTYGLFAANPFGQHHFIGGEPTAGHTLAAGEAIHFQYKVLLHAGNANVELIEANWKQFANQAKTAR